MTGADEMRPGERLLVRRGNRATQIAQVIEPLEAGQLRVRKWSSAGHRWESPCWIPESDVIRHSFPGEVSFLPGAE